MECNKWRGLICKRAKGWRGSLRNRGKGRGFFGKDAIFLLLPPRETEEWRGQASVAFGRRPWATIADGRRGKRSREARGADPRPRREGRWPVEAWPRRRAAAGDGDCGGSAARLDGGLELGEKHEGALGIRFPRSPWAMAACGRLPVAAGGARRLWWWRRRWRARGGLCGGGASCGGGGRRWDPFIGADCGGGVEHGGGRPVGSAGRL